MEKNKDLFVYNLKVGDFLHDLSASHNSVCFIKKIERITKECVVVHFDVFFPDGSFGSDYVSQAENKEGDDLFYFDSASFDAIKKIDENDFICFCEEALEFGRKQIDIEVTRRHVLLMEHKKRTQEVLDYKWTSLINFEKNFNIVMNEKKNGTKKQKR